VRNSSLVEWSCAENVTGLKPTTEAPDSGGQKSEVRVPEEVFETANVFQAFNLVTVGFRDFWRAA